MSNLHSLLFSLSVFLLTLACSDDRGGVSPDGTANMISNSSFENLDGPSADGWLISEELVGFEQDAPPGGGGWALVLNHGMPPEWGWAQISISDQVGKHVYHLTSRAKSAGGGGAICFGAWSDNDWVQEKHVMISADANEWAAYEIVDTLDVRATDSLRIILWGCGLEVEPGAVLFDLVQVRKLSQ
jgi:hypothetical protein